jgi:hypothetical protein
VADGRVNLASLQADPTFFKEQGLMTSDSVGVKDVVDSSFVETAFGTLGPHRAQPKP